LGKFDKTNQTARSFFFLGLCILSWGLIPVVTKQILGELNNLQMLFSSTLFSCMVMGGLVLFQNKASVLATYSIHDYAKIGGLGFLGHAHQLKERAKGCPARPLSCHAERSEGSLPGPRMPVMLSAAKGLASLTKRCFAALSMTARPPLKSARGARCEPKPDPPPTIMVGAFKPRMLRLATRYAAVGFQT